MTENVPVYCFTIPSVVDGTVLDCRIYHPDSLQDAQSTQQRSRKAALIAHPYAPLGGSMDDAVVTSVVDQLRIEVPQILMAVPAGLEKLNGMIISQLSDI
jgi:hypothetical protein